MNDYEFKDIHNYDILNMIIYHDIDNYNIKYGS